MCFFLYLYTISVDILMALWLSTQMLVGESIVTPNSWRIPCNKTHKVAALTASLYLAFDDESEMMFCFLLDQKIGASANMKTKPDVDFLSIGLPAQYESENPASWSEELAV